MRKDSFETKRESKPELQKRCLPSSRSPPVAHRSSAWPTVASRGPGELRRGPYAESGGRERESRGARRLRPGDRGKETAARALHQGERGGRGAKERGEPGVAKERGEPGVAVDRGVAGSAEETFRRRTWCWIRRWRRLRKIWRPAMVLMALPSRRLGVQAVPGRHGKQAALGA
jgi:hypothetical protein